MTCGPVSPCAQDHLSPSELVPTADALKVDLDCVGSVPRPGPSCLLHIHSADTF